MRLYIGLVHYPVYNKNRLRIASAITNFDLHDLSRAARTYGVKKFYVITPLAGPAGAGGPDPGSLEGRVRCPVQPHTGKRPWNW